MTKFIMEWINTDEKPDTLTCFDIMNLAVNITDAFFRNDLEQLDRMYSWMDTHYESLEYKGFDTDVLSEANLVNVSKVLCEKYTKRVLDIRHTMWEEEQIEEDNINE